MARAAPHTGLLVTKTADTNDGSCDALDCSLREAVIAANATAEAEVIVVPAGTYALTLYGPGEDAAATGDLDIMAGVVISGGGAASVSAAGLGDRVFQVLAQAGEVTLAGLAITGGSPGPCPEEYLGGGGILNAATLTVADSVVSGNTACHRGGGIASVGSLVLVRSTVAGNTTSCMGGGVDGRGGLTLVDSTIRDNVVHNVSGGGASGGGIAFAGDLGISGSTIAGNTVHAVEDSSQANNALGAGVFHYDYGLSMVNSTLSGNYAVLESPSGKTPAGQAMGGGLYAGSYATLNHVTIVANHAEASGGGRSVGGGIGTADGWVEATNTLLAGNVAAHGPDCEGTLDSHDHNLIENPSGCEVEGALVHSVLGQAARLGPLQFNGGRTPTHALLPGSPAIDAGCPVACEPRDQRGVPRPQGHACDIGAFEAHAPVWLPAVMRSQP
jgi:CSLREA domain-containing protein